jgi:hypothetical protein
VALAPIHPPHAPPAPRPRLVPEWRAPWLQDAAHLRPEERQPPYPEGEDEIEEYLHHLRTQLGQVSRMHDRLRQ